VFVQLLVPFGGFISVAIHFGIKNPQLGP